VPAQPTVVESGHPLTDEQATIVGRVGSGTGHILVEALAGSGKTSTIMASLGAVAVPKVLLCAFNKANRVDFEAKLAKRPKPRRGHVLRARTSHQLGYAVLKAHGCRAEATGDATETLVNKVALQIEEAVTKDRAKAIADGVPIEKWEPWFPLGIVEGTDAAVISFPVRRSAITLLRRLKETCVARDVDEEDIDLLGREIDAFARIDEVHVHLVCTIVRLAYLNGMRLDRDAIDHCDSIWLPMVLDLEPRSRFDLIFVDEAQDLSNPQFALVKRHLTPDGRLVVVGDLHQSVYGWRGAEGDAVWAEMRAAGAITMPLTVSFRCSRVVVEVANEIVPKLRACEGAPIGEVRCCSFTQMLAELPTVREHTFVLSRSNAPLFQTALQLWFQKERFHYSKSEEMASGLRAIIDKLDVNNAEHFVTELEKWYREEHGRAEARSAAAWADRVDQQHEMLLALLDYAKPADLGRVLDDLVESKGSFVTLSTVHGVKGFEADQVYLLQQTFARHRAIDEDESIPEEELNLEYVAITRAKRELVWVDLEELEMLKARRRLSAR
jgi:superfamily I DNA/RNA helicase